MKSLVVVCALASALLGQAVRSKDIRVTKVAGESWLSHLHRTLEETSMGKTGRLGPSVPVKDISGRQAGTSAAFATQDVTLRGSDLYRLNCQGCHGESGLGAPPEINSVINPTRATSAAITMKRMKKLGMNISRADAAELAKQSKTALLHRVHHGGQDMPPFPHLSEPEVRAIVAYLSRLAGIPGTEREQAAVEESSVRLGEHIVKSTCHICHNAAGPNPAPGQLSNGAIPPLNTLTTRTSLPEFIRKVRIGAPITMGMPPMPCRGRMPVFYYLSENEVADVYLYLTLYPPYAGAVLDPGMPAPPLDRAASEGMPFIVDSETTKARTQGGGTDTRNFALPLVVELFATLLLAGGLGFTVREFRRFGAKSEVCNILVIGGANVAPDVTRPVQGEFRRHHELRVKELAATDKVTAMASSEDQAVSHSRFAETDCRIFESAWLARRLENEDWVA